MADINDRISAVYKRLALREPFIAAVLTKVNRSVGNDPSIPTAGTDGKTIFFNAEFCSTINDRELFGVLVHEALHVIMLHSWRRNNRDPMLWNLACDAVINRYIISKNYTLPKGAFFHPRVEAEHDAEQAYRILQDERDKQQQSGGGSGDGDGDGSGSGDGDQQPQHKGGFDGQGDLLDAPDDEGMRDLKATISASAKMAKAAGQADGLIERLIDDISNPKVDWRDALRSMMTASSAADYTYNRPSRRFIGSGMYLPSLHSEALGPLLIAVDTSGSVSDQELAQIASEIKEIAGDLNPERIDVVYCDYSVKHVERFEAFDDFKLNAMGGGGTRFQPVFEHAQQSGERYIGMIYFTDMMGDLHECQEPEYPVIWADTYGKYPNAPFGEVVSVQL